MKKNSLPIFIALIVLSNTLIIPQSDNFNTSSFANDFIKGADVSTLLQVENNGGVFTENGIIKDPIQIFKDHGLNYVRLKIWHTPSSGYNDLSKVLIMAQRIKKAGLKFLLDFHYSDTWADPGHQSKPADWSGLSFQSLKDSVYSYSKNIITILKNNGVLPNIVQIGNEIICGMLWNDGRICDQYNNPQQWNNFGDLVKAGIRGVKDSLDLLDTVQIMIHIDRGGDNAGARWFFDGLLAEGIEFDIIGLSYYRWWQGTFNDLQNNLNDLALRYNKEIVIVETAYPWTLSWNDNTANIVGNPNQLLDGYPASTQGQKNFLIDLINLIKNVPNNKGIGLVYWEPEWIAAPNLGSPWENLTLFGFSGELLESITAFDSALTNSETPQAVINSFQLFQNYPNPFNPSTKIKFLIPGSVETHHGVSLRVYDILGTEVATLVNDYKSAGSYEVEFSGNGLSASGKDALNLPSGIYFYRLQAGNFIETKKMLLLR